MLLGYRKLSERCETAAASGNSHEVSRGVHPVRGVSETFPPGGALPAAYGSRLWCPECSRCLFWSALVVLATVGPRMRTVGPLHASNYHAMSKVNIRATVPRATSLRFGFPETPRVR